MAVPALHAPINTVHIDVVAKSSSLTPYGLPFCDRFFVTYDAQLPLLQDKIIATYGSLNTYNALITGPRSINVGCAFAQDAHMPDVAGIERNIPGIGLRDIACLTWVTGGGIWPNGNVYVYYNEWDPAGGVGCGAVTSFMALDGPGTGPVYTHFTRPRIDANDNYGSNGSTGICQSKVVSEVFNGFSAGTADIGIYNYNVAGGVTSTGWIDVNPLEFPVGSGLYPFPVGGTSAYYHYAPAVAYGQNGGSEYMVTECASVTGYGDFFLMSPIGVSCSSVVAGSSFYELNTAYPVVSSNYANAVSTPVNMVWDTSLVAWTAGGNIYYKRSGYSYAYKQSPGNHTAIANDALSIAPNPATGIITVHNPDNAADWYIIKNMIGQKIEEGNVTSEETSIKISNLAEGNYLISFYKGGIPAGNHLFVKQ